MRMSLPVHATVDDRFEFLFQLIHDSFCMQIALINNLCNPPKTDTDENTDTDTEKKIQIQIETSASQTYPTTPAYAHLVAIANCQQKEIAGSKIAARAALAKQTLITI